MAKVSKNSKITRGNKDEAKNMVKVIKAFKSKAGSYSFKEKIVHKDAVQDFLSEKI